MVTSLSNQSLSAKSVPNRDPLRMHRKLFKRSWIFQFEIHYQQVDGEENSFRDVVSKFVSIERCKRINLNILSSKRASGNA